MLGKLSCHLCVLDWWSSVPTEVESGLERGVEGAFKGAVTFYWGSFILPFFASLSAPNSYRVTPGAFHLKSNYEKEVTESGGGTQVAPHGGSGSW